jgi:NACalpha-BTF3-like transcription factor
MTDWIDEQFEVVKVPNKNSKQIAFVLFDPNARILKSVKFKKGFNELSAQLQKAPNMLDRYDALNALRETEIEKKRDLLLADFAKETFVQMKAEIMYQLVNDEKSAATLQQIFSTDRNQAAKLNAIKLYNGNDVAWKNTFIKALSDSSYDVVTAALEKLCNTYPQEAASFLQSTKGVQGMNNSVRIKWLELSAIHNIDRQKCLDELVWLAGNQWEFRTRNNAFTAIKTLSYCNEKLVANLFDAMLNTNSRLAGPAQQLADYLCTQAANKNMFVAYYKTQTWEKWQVDLLKKQLGFL